MKRTSTVGRLQRLDFLKARLNSGDPTTINDLANELDVSVRTINRDINVLRDQGEPIETERGKGGGIRLPVCWGVGRASFSYAEAVDLLITLAIAEQMRSSLFMANLKGIRNKLLSSLSPILKNKVKNLKQRILITQSASIYVLSEFPGLQKKIVEPLHQAFLMQSRISIRYGAKNENVTTRTIQPHYFLLSYPVWYILAWDELRNDIRTFRCDRIIKVTKKENEFKLLPISRFQRALSDLDTI
ncbi:WYL domain-containing protein [Puniceicoccaceae bacterium K14]|nr:WYL domain-containing protein [Puniceicoccaceae bacterium K14]